MCEVALQTEGDLSLPNVDSSAYRMRHTFLHNRPPRVLGLAQVSDNCMALVTSQLSIVPGNGNYAVKINLGKYMSSWSALGPGGATILSG